VLRRLIDEGGPIDPATDRRGSRPDAYEALVRAIVGQQLSTKAAGSIWEKLQGAFGGKTPSPAELLAADESTVRGAGLSRAKVGFLRDLATRITEGDLDLERLTDLPDEDVTAALIEVHGIGRWTAEMFLIFVLNRPDVLPVDDLGLREGVRVLDGLAERPGGTTVTEMAERWRPWRTVATWYLWRGAGMASPNAQASMTKPQ
jgi:DNA-3-methyladenine glycosylase II